MYFSHLFFDPASIMNKFVLLNPREFESLKKAGSQAETVENLLDPETARVKELNKNMNTHLSDDNLTMMQKLNRYETDLMLLKKAIKEVNQKPLLTEDVSVKQGGEPGHGVSARDRQREVYNVDRGIETLPNNTRKKAQNLYKFIQEKIPQLELNGRGELVDDGRTIPGSHIIDILGDLTKNLKGNQNVAKGYDAALWRLEQANVPKTMLNTLTRSRMEDTSVTPPRRESAKVRTRSKRQISITPHSSDSNSYLSVEDSRSKTKKDKARRRITQWETP